jgi:diguanylate cyclase (GGDEF)-like protein/PAS domain S-box-containing protein
MLRSLQTRITLGTLVIFLFSLWSMAFYASRALREDMQRLLGAAQFSAVSLVAEQVNQALLVRLKALDNFATSRIDAGLVAKPATLQARLEGSPVLQGMFNAGAFVTDAQGTAIAFVPLATGRVGVNFMERDHVAGALKEGRTSVGQPVIGKITGIPVISMAAPIRDPLGNIIGALVGVIDLSKPNFLDPLTQNRYGNSGGYVVVSVPQQRIIAATDKSRVMQALTPPDAIAQTARFSQGVDGYAVYTDPGAQEVLSASKHISAAPWTVGATMPTEEAFAPIRNLQQRMLLAALLLTLVAGSLGWWLLRRQLAPLQKAAQALSDQARTGLPVQPLPVARNDEIGHLVRGFNHLLQNLSERELALAQSEQRFRTAFQTAPDAITITRLADGVYLEVNDSFSKLTGWTHAQAIGKTPRELNLWHNPDDRRRIEKTMRHDGQVESLEADFVTRQGRILRGLVSVRTIVFEGEACGLAVAHDITERKSAEEALRLTASVFTYARECITITDSSGAIIDVNEAFSRITGYQREEVLGQNPRILQSGRHDRQFYAAMWSELLENGHWSGEIWNRRKNGELFPEQITISAVCDEEKRVQRYVALFSDISERKQMEEQVRQLAFYDPLTHLPNRRLLGDRLQQTMAASKRSGLYGAILFLDMDNFKPVNDTHGHVVGDLLLVEVARRLTTCVREVDTLARYGGDEFVVLLGGLQEDRAESTQQARSVAEKIAACLCASYRLPLPQSGSPSRELEHHCSVSIGVVLFSGQDAGPDEVLQWADLAMYQAKKVGPNSISFHQPDP